MFVILISFLFLIAYVLLHILFLQNLAYILNTLIYSFQNTLDYQWNNFKNFLTFSLAQLLIFAVMIVTDSLNHLLKKRIMFNFKNKLQLKYLKAISCFTHKNFDSNFPLSQLSSRLTNDVERFVSVLTESIFTITKSILFIFAFLLLYSWISPIFSIASLAVAFIIGSGSFWFRKKSTQKQNKLSYTHQQYLKKLNEFLDNYKMLYINNNIDLILIQTSPEARNKFKTVQALDSLNNIRSALLNFLSTFCISIVEFSSFTIIIFALLPNITIGNVLVISGFLHQISFYINALFISWVDIKSLKKLKEKINIKNLCNTTQLNHLNVFENVKIHKLEYKIKKTFIFKNINFEIQKGQKIAIFGTSGVGKSTFLKIIAGIIENYGGIVKINGTNYNSLNKFSLWELLAYCDSKDHIFDSSIRNNVTLFDSSLPLKKALKAADLLKDFPNDVSWNINALTLSEGQRQKLLLARTFIQNKPIIILDELLSNIDINSAETIKRNISDMYSVTLLIVSHRIQNEDTFFDKILDFTKLKN